MRLIDADELIAEYGDWYTEEGNEEGYIGTIKGIVNKMPTIEPQRMRGRWEYLDYGGVGNYHCSACRRICVNKGDYDFCPFCGADMRGTE